MICVRTFGNLGDVTYSMDVVNRALVAARAGLPYLTISRQLGVSRSAIRSWVEADPDVLSTGRARLTCEGGTSCELVHGAPPKHYAYLLGQYLGDGCLSDNGRRVYRLRIIACSAYPGIAAEIRAAMVAVFPSNSVGSIQREGCQEIYLDSKHAICLFPQHGRGPKHTRRIEVMPWQAEIVDSHPRDFLRGLLHSDGCRSMNRVKVKGGYREYPRYFFSNRSADILGIFTRTCDQLGVAWRQNYTWSISIARRDSVAFVDTFVGPKD